MWLFTRHGFFSAVAGKDADGRPDPDTVVVRSRNRRHLVWLLREIGDPTVKISESEDTDYPCRIVICAADWWDLATHLAEDVDYTNFKDAAHDDGDPAWNALLMQVWSAGLQYGQGRREEARWAEDAAGPRRRKRSDGGGTPPGRRKTR